MSTDDRTRFEEIALHLNHQRELVYLVTINGAQTSGTMIGVGWRAGMDGGKSMGIYQPRKKDSVSVQKWRALQAELPKSEAHYIYFLNKLLPYLLSRIKKRAKELRVPSISQAEFGNLVADDPFASNITATWDDFANKFPRDNDTSKLTYGIWFPVSNTTGKLKSKADGFACHGGVFVNADYRVYVDFDACDGVVEIVWQGPEDAHATTSSVRGQDSNRLGTSVQINEKLAKRVERLLREEGVIAAGRILGLAETLDRLQTLEHLR